MSTSNLVNIGGDPNDPHYRYKRNKIETRTINKKGGLTQITNLDIIAKQLKVGNKKTREKFCDKFDAKIKKKGIFVLEPRTYKGNISVNELEKELNDIIKKYILYICINKFTI